MKKLHMGSSKRDIASMQMADRDTPPVDFLVKNLLASDDVFLSLALSSNFK